MSKRFMFTLITLLVILAGAGVAVFLSKGYTFSTKEKRIVGTGLISVTSVPDGASVYIDGHLTTATNTTLPSLPPKTYKIKIVKEGLVPWEKEIEVKEGLVSEIKATLFPAIPFAYPLSYNGAVNPSISPDGQRLAFAVPFVDDQHVRQKGGVWVWNMNTQTISISRSAEPHQVVASTPSLDFSKATFRWSPDSKQLLATLQEGEKQGVAFSRNYLLSADQFSSVTDLRDITPLVTTTLQSWDEEEKLQSSTAITTIKDLQIRKIASDSASASNGVLTWSPDETKFITGSTQTSAISSQTNKQKNLNTNSEATPKAGEAILKAESSLKGFKVYDLGSSKQPSSTTQITPISQISLVPSKTYDLPEALEYYWLPDSKHIILVQKEKISIVEFDGSNEAVIYAGSFENGFVFPWPDSSRLAIVASTPTSSKPNLFGINLK